MSTRAFSAISFLLALAPFAAADYAAPKIYSVNELPAEYRGGRIEATEPLPLTKLRLNPKADHRVGPGDVLGIMIEKLMGDDSMPTIAPLHPSERRSYPNGYPILVRDDGAIELPFISPLDVNGLTLVQVERAIRNAYSGMPNILKTGNERIVVKLLQPRKCHVVVMREKEPSVIPFGASRADRHNKYHNISLDLPIGENDVLSALAYSGGLPGVECKSELLIYKKSVSKKATVKKDDTDSEKNSAADEPGTIIHVPLRLRPGQSPPFEDKDIVLDNGDVVYVELRQPEYYSTAGLLGTGQYQLPLDHDLDVIEAISHVDSRGAYGGSCGKEFGPPINFFKSGFEFDVLRTISNSQKLLIKIDIEETLTDPKQRLVLLPGDIVVAREKCAERTAAAPTSVAMKVNDIVALSLGGVSDEVIIHQMETTRSRFELTTTDILELKKNRVSDRLIVEMQDRRPNGP
jgi:protein involved in polysaccharide export with SLBB domain